MSLFCGTCFIIPLAIFATLRLARATQTGTRSKLSFWLWMALIWVPIVLAASSELHWMLIGEREAIARGEGI